MYFRLLLAMSLLLIVLMSGGCAAISDKFSSSFDKQFNTIAQPYRFNFAGWEYDTLYHEIKQGLTDPQPDAALNSQSVFRYFSYVNQANSFRSDLQVARAKRVQADIVQHEGKLDELEIQLSALKPVAEQTIARQINQTLADQGIYNPFVTNWLKVTFPPVRFKLEKPLYVLIISPRDKIQQIRSVTLNPDINTTQIEKVESSLDNLNVSSLVIEIGGLGATYPTYVADNADLQFTLITAAHEWAHQYLAFKPLGFLYILDLLGILPNYQIKTINETVASIAGQELGTIVYNKYYTPYRTDEGSPESRPVTSGFDFNGAMREIRKTVDDYLVNGQVQQAEQYMHNQQQYLVSQGYYIRKLNQAYFAFYGSYADSPTSIDPIGNQLKSLRAQSLSLKSFLDTAAGFSSRQDLTDALNKRR